MGRFLELTRTLYDCSPDVKRSSIRYNVPDSIEFWAGVGTKQIASAVDAVLIGVLINSITNQTHERSAAIEATGKDFSGSHAVALR